jgi:trehalose 6-phosphate phosphatase
MTSVRPAVALGQAALLLDFDGALARFRNEPEEVRPTAERTELLRELQLRLDGRLAVLSGRTIADLDRVTNGEVKTVAALNGLQRRAPGRRIPDPPPHRSLAEVADLLAALARTWPGVRTEPKGLSVAVHYRHAPEAEVELRRILAGIGRSTGLELQEGSMVMELATPGWNKGRAVADLMSFPPFRGATPIFVGDDAADEPGFAAAAEIGGVGVLVGEARRTRASARIASPEALCAWLWRALQKGAFDLPPRAP